MDTITKDNQQKDTDLTAVEANVKVKSPDTKVQEQEEHLEVDDQEEKDKLIKTCNTSTIANVDDMAFGDKDKEEMDDEGKDDEESKEELQEE